ncbi:MAG TPA: hypothetical protein VK708_11055 [Bryobacteraceae bacterium]|jgi:hypothetical protein|nr:hypothetical protein [Bryobacteraceae bacterium]
MSIRGKRLRTVWLLAALVGPTALIAQKRYVAPGVVGEITQPVVTELWREPQDIRSENLFYGAGGKEHEPHGPFTFVKEDLDGTNPKYDVRDENGVKWKIKLGPEAQPETAASRFVWAVGYHVDEDYFAAEIQVNGLPAHVHRGQHLIGAGGVMRNARLKREDDKKEGIWRWRENPFADTRELDGLRVMMAIINNWDLKDANNAIRNEKRKDDGDKRVYEVSDLGASFGTTGRGLSTAKSKGNLNAYTRSKFITKERPEFVNFATPSHPTLLLVFDPHEFFSRMGMRGLGRNVPRQNARWIGDMLGQLSPDQIRDAFRSAGYEGAELDGFAADFARRVEELKKL